MLKTNEKLNTESDVVLVSTEQLCARLISLEDDFVGTTALAFNHLERCRELHLPSPTNALRSNCEQIPVDSDVLTSSLLAAVEPYRLSSLSQPLSSGIARFILKQYAPQAILSGCVLQNFASASNSHEVVPALVHAIHNWQAGGGKTKKNRSILYRRVLDSIGVDLSNISADGFAGSVGFLASAWELPAYWLSLSVFPEERRYEILGAMLFEVAMGLSSLVVAAGVNTSIEDAEFFIARTSSERKFFVDLATTAIREAMSQLHPTTQDVVTNASRRIAEGFHISLALHEAWTQELISHVQHSEHEPYWAMVRLVERKGKYAVGYHSRLKLGGRPFDDGIVADAEAFVRDLGASRWVSPGHPEQSLLLTTLTSFGGPMFRIFSNTELDVIHQWIVHLSGEHRVNQSMVANQVLLRRAPALRASSLSPKISERRAEADLSARELYFRLLNVEQYPDARDHALQFVRTWLARSDLELASNACALPLDAYSHHRLRSWFEGRALAQARSYSVGTAAVIDKSREEVIREALQLCPMVLIDGAWLQRWGSAGLVDTAVGSVLYKIFSDEIGNGDTRLNHPNIYRSLMAQMGESLPDFRSRDFAYLERFDDESFATPAFWLGLSQFPRKFMPETLGLNLAMELSGVGGTYRTARDELRHYGFSTLFVDLHNTIDNVSTGHSAMAVEAIEMYMDQVNHLNDEALNALHWRRVCVGYSALVSPARSWREKFRRPRYLLNSFGQEKCSSQGKK